MATTTTSCLACGETFTAYRASTKPPPKFCSPRQGASRGSRRPKAGGRCSLAHSLGELGIGRVAIARMLESHPSERSRDIDPVLRSEKARESYVRHADKRRAERRAAYWVDPERARAAASAWAKRNPDKTRDYNARRRARINGAPVVEKIDRQTIYDRDAGRCHICGGRVPRDVFVLDHLDPLIHGGEHSARNVAVAHPSCNASRGPGRIPAQLRLVG